VERVYLVWWALLIVIGIAGVWRLIYVLAKDRAINIKIILLIASLLLVAGAAFVCPAMLTFDYDGVSCTQNQFVISWLMHTAALSTLVISFRSGSSKRARRYLDSR
jgi:hypothetical protein